MRVFPLFFGVTMSTKLEKLLAQVAEEKARIKAEEKGRQAGQIGD